MNRAELGVLATATALATTVGTAGFAMDGLARTTDARAGDGRAGALLPLVVRQDTVRSVFDSEDGLFPGHSADITMRVSNPNHVPMTVTGTAPATTAAKTVTGGTTPDDTATHAYCADRLTLAPAPTFTIDDPAGTHRIPPGTETTLTLHAAVTLSPDTDNRCQRMHFETHWTVSGQSA